MAFNSQLCARISIESYWKHGWVLPSPPYHLIHVCVVSPPSLLQMDGAKLGLQASLLVRSAETGELFVNFDPEILTQIREADCMSRMALEVPPFAGLLQRRQASLKGNFNKLQVRICF